MFGNIKGSESKQTTARTAYKAPSGIKQADFEREIEAGMPNEVARMRDAWDCLRYSMGRFEEYPTSHKDQRYRSPAVRRTTPIFKRIVEVLTMHLYKNQPTRRLKNEQASGFLEAIYRRNYLWPKWKRLDALTLIGGFGALQFSGSTDPHSPVDIYLWGADQLAVWVDPDDAIRPIAVATLDRHNGEKRVRLWTREQVVTFVSDQNVIHAAFAARSFKFQSRKPNPYKDRNGEGILPFSFAHWTFPTQEFETNSPGLNLKELNHGVNERLDNLGDSIYFHARPIGIANNVDDSWTPPGEIRPGDFLKLPASSIDAGGNGPLPTLSYLAPEVAHITADWADMNNWLDHELEMWGIPPAMIRMVQSGAASGIALQTEQLPLLGYVEGRRADFACYEEEAAHRCMEITDAHLRNVGLQAEADQVNAELEAWSFSLHWPVLYIQLPGPDRDRADDWRLAKGDVSIVGIVQERHDLTEDEAFEHLQKVAEQKAKLETMGIAQAQPKPAPLGPPNPDQAEAPAGEADESGNALEQAQLVDPTTLGD